MALAFKVTKIEDVAEAFRSLYVKTTDGTYQLEVDGAVDNKKLDEFRENNIKLLKEAEKFKDLNPEKYAELMKLQQQREEKELLDKGEVDKVIENRVKAMRTEFDTEKTSLMTTNAAMTRQLETLMIDNTVRTVATKNGVRPEAVDDILLRAKTMFRIQEGKVVSLDGEGKIVYGKDGTTPLSIDEWTPGLKATAPHLFMSSQGGGGQGSGGPANNTRVGQGVSKISAALAENPL